MIRLLLTALALTGVPALPAMAANLFDSCDEGRMVSVGQVAAAVDCLTQKIVPGELVVNNEQLEQMQQALEQMARVVAAPGQRMGLPIGLMPQVYPGIQELPQGKVVMLSNGSGYSAPAIVGTIYPYELRITIDNKGYRIRLGNSETLSIGDRSCNLLFVEALENGSVAKVRLLCD